jgi:hypothetical protein
MRWYKRWGWRRVIGEGEEGTPTSFGVIGSDRGGGRGAVARG